MTIAKNKWLNKFFIVALIFSLVAPYIGSVANAEETTGSDAQKGSLTIYKYKQEKGATQTPGTGSAGETPSGEPLKDVTFTITQTHSFDPETDKWSEVNGTPKDYVTDENGEIKIENIPLGRYTVKETAGPVDVILNDEEFSVDIPMTNPDGKTLNYNVVIYPKNEIIRSNVELVKQDESGKALEEVQFGLFKDDGTRLDVLSTNAEGKIILEKLPAGKYYFQEVKTVEGYTLNTTKIPFEVRKKADGKTIEVVWTDTAISNGNVVTNYATPTIEKDVEDKKEHSVNRDKEYTYNITVKTPGDIDKYSVLGVRDILDDRLTYVDGSWEVEGIDEEKLSFKQDGQTLVWEINKDNLEGLKANTEFTISFKAKIKPNAELKDNETGIPNDASVHFSNGKGTYTEPADPGKDPFDPENPDPENPYNPYKPNDPDKPTNPTNPNEPGTPPNPVDPPTTPPVIVIPTDGGFALVKVDKDNNEVKLAGAEFKITTDKDGKNVVNAKDTVIKVTGATVGEDGTLQNLVTGEDGKITIEGLPVGTYYLHETKAPTYIDDNGEEKTYRLLTKPVEVKVDNAKTINVTVENSKSAWYLPGTGGIGTVIFYAVGIALMASAFFAFSRKRKKQVA